MLECEQLYAGTHCHVGALHQMSAFHAFCSEWPYGIFSSVLQYKTWLSSQVADFFDTGIQKLISCYDKCLNSGGDYIEK
jgi:hypothetical protein